MLTDLLTLVGVPAQGPALNRNTSDTKGLRFGKSTSTVSSTSSNKKLFADVKPTVKRLSSGLSAEENRILKSVRAQNSRRGGFVRIFPTHDR